MPDSIDSSRHNIPAWQPGPKKPIDPDGYLQALLRNHPEDTYYGQVLRRLFNLRGLDIKRLLTSPNTSPTPLAESPKETPKPATPDTGKSQGEKKKAA